MAERHAHAHKRGALKHNGAGCCALLCACTLLLGGCLHTTKANFTKHYDLGGSAQSVALAAAADAASHGRRVLRIARIDVPAWLAGTAMYYRLDYRDDAGLAAYAQSDWAAPPATLLETVIRRVLAASGNWQAVIGPHSLATSDVSVHIRLNDFSQSFDQPTASDGVIGAMATLIDNHDHHVIAQSSFHVEVTARTPDAQGGAQALGEASREFAVDLRNWLHSVGPNAIPTAR